MLDRPEPEVENNDSHELIVASGEKDLTLIGLVCRNKLVRNHLKILLHPHSKSNKI